MTRVCLKTIAFGALVFLLPAFAAAQASITGVVTDTSGAVLPGVTVEAASPALIEKVRTVVSDGSGQYRLIDLRPGTYSTTFSLAGFNSLKREGIELAGSFTATVNAELRVGALAETVTVSGQSPIVDVQAVLQQRVFSQEVLDALPTGRTPVYAAILVPGMTVSARDVGGSNNLPLTGGQLAIHGSSGQEQRLFINGMSTHDAEGTGAYGAFVVNMAAAQEVVVSYASGTAEQSTGGVQTNVIPREGGNRFSGSLFLTGVNDKFQGSNYSQDLQDRGLRTPDRIRRSYDVNPGVGGPLMRDRLWFFTAARFVGTSNYIAGMFENANKGDATKWAYVPDTSRPGFNSTTSESVNLRLTLQASKSQKLSLFHDQQGRCTCPDTLSTSSSEAVSRLFYPLHDMTSANWTFTPTNRLLLEAGSSVRRERYTYAVPEGQTEALIGVRELGGSIPGLTYRGGVTSGGTFGLREPGFSTYGLNWHSAASASYVPGAHAFKLGVGNNHVHRDTTALDNPFAVTYTFREGVPQSLLQRATPWEQFVRQPFDLGFYAQDKWTVTPIRLTLNLGIRFDYFRMYNQADTLGPGLLVPNRNISIPETPLINFKDISPRVAAAFDVFGSGKTALKVGLNKYMGVLGPQLNFMNGILTPIEALANTATRSWNDRLFGIGDPRTGNYVPDCDLTANAANGECGIVSNTNFGRSELVYSQTSDPRTATGFGNRPYQWEVSAGVQQALTPRISVDAGYFRRWRGNFTVVDNFALSASDFSPYSVTAPTDPRLPESGNVIAPFFDINPNVVSLPPVNVNMPASDYGKQTQGWQGMDITLNARLGQGVVVQGGFSTGRATSNNCEVLAKVPEADRVGQPFCDRVGDWESQLKLLGTYVIPKIDVQLAGTFQSYQVAVLQANYVVSNAVVRESLGRDLSASAPNVIVPLLQPGSLFGETMNQLDLRLSKALTFGHTRNMFSVDINNALNNNAVLSENTTYQNPTPTGWRVPTSILTARFFRLSYQLNF